MMKSIAAVVMLGLLGACSSDGENGVLAESPETVVVSAAAAHPTVAPAVVTVARGTTTTTGAASTTSAVQETAAEAPTTVAPLTVTEVVDGDTVQLSTGERVRIVGIDAPEAGTCGSDRATDRLNELVSGRTVVAPAGARDDVDRYGRVLRYLDVGGVDTGLTLIQEGWAIARYDSRDGYGRHTRESEYVQASDDAEAVRHAGPCSATPGTAPPRAVAAPRPLAGPIATSEPAPVTTVQRTVSYTGCAAVRAAGADPIHAGEPGYSRKLDRDGDGVACE